MPEITESSTRLLAAIGDVVTAAPEVMRYLQKVARSMARVGIEPDWRTPSGFHVFQINRRSRCKHIQTRLFGGARFFVNMNVEVPQIDIGRHTRGIVANLVHSMDAAHLVMSINALPEGQPFGVVHDCFQVRPGDAPQTFDVLLQELVRLYETDPLRQFHDHLSRLYQWALLQEGESGSLPPLPEYGDLDLEDVIESNYAFS